MLFREPWQVWDPLILVCGVYSILTCLCFLPNGADEHYIILSPERNRIEWIRYPYLEKAKKNKRTRNLEKEPWRYLRNKFTENKWPVKEEILAFHNKETQLFVIILLEAPQFPHIIKLEFRQFNGKYTVKLILWSQKYLDVVHRTHKQFK